MHEVDDRCGVDRQAALVILGLSSSRAYHWPGQARACNADGATACLRRKPNQLTPAEASTIKGMATSPEYRHAPTGRLAKLAERLGKVFASRTT